MKAYNAALFLLVLIVAYACKKNDSQNNNGSGNGNGGNTDFTITGTSPEYVFWGEELTISGTGFSTNPSDYSFQWLSDASCIDSFKTTIISASATQIKIKAPIATYPNSTAKCGPAFLNVVMSMNGKKDTTETVKMAGWPYLGDVCLHYSGGVAGNYFIPGDSALVDVVGATGVYAQASGGLRNVSLSTNNMAVPLAWHNSSSCGNGGGAALMLDANHFAERKCPTDADWNGGWRTIAFTAKVPGTNREVTRDYLVKWQPEVTYSGYSGPSQVSLSAGGNPQWTITGKNMYYEKARFVPVNCSNATPQDLTFNSGVDFYSSASFAIPLSVLSAPCTYNVIVLTRCGNGRLVGSIQIMP